MAEESCSYGTEKWDGSLRSCRGSVSRHARCALSCGDLWACGECAGDYVEIGEEQRGWILGGLLLCQGSLWTCNL